MHDGRRLGHIQLLGQLTDDERDQIAEACTWRRFAAGQEIISYHAESRDVYFMVEGQARVVIYSYTGKPVAFRDVRPGEIVGEFAAIDEGPRSASVEATAPSLTASLRPDAFWQALNEHPEMIRALLRGLTAQVRVLTERVLEFSTLGVKNRLHAELLRLASRNLRDDGSALVSPVPTHAELASRISTHREAVTRELNSLSRSGVLARSGDRLTIHDVQALSHLVEQALGETLMDLN